MGLTHAQKYNRMLDQIWENARKNGVFDRINGKWKEDVKILEALYFGTHLEPNEFERAKHLVYGLNKNLEGRR